MQLIFRLIIMWLIFLGLFLLGISIDLKELYKRVKLGAGSGARRLEEVAEQSRGSLLGKFMEYTESLIQQSNVRMYVAYNIWIHFLIAGGIGFLGYSWIIQYLDKLTSLAFAILMIMLPFMILQILSDVMAHREKKHATNFLSTFKNFFISGKNDIFEAFEKMVPYVAEPIKSYVEVMIEEHRSRINQFTCLENFKKKLGTEELRLWVENLSICQARGGGVVELTDAFVHEISLLEEDEDKEDAEDKMLGYGLYLLIFLNFVIITWILKSPYKREVMDSLWGKIVFVMDMLICCYIVFMTLKKN